MTDNKVGVQDNNVYLAGPEDYLTMNPTNGVNPSLGHIKVGVSINSGIERKKVIYTENEVLLEAINNMLKNALSGGTTNSLYDDAHRYEPLISAEQPYQANFLYFVRVWPCAVTDEELEAFFKETSPKIIDTPKKLAMFMMLVNGYRLEGEDHHEAYYPGLQGIVVADLDMSGAGWLPIAGKKGEGLNNPFTGSFDGGSHVISNLHVDNGYALYDDFGLFGKTVGATIKNVVIDNCKFVSGETQRMGALICNMKGGTVANCVASGTVDASGSETLPTTTDGVATDELYCVVGGLIGEVGIDEEHPNATITNCMSTVKVGAEPKEPETMYPRSQKITAGGLIGMTSREPQSRTAMPMPR